MLDQQTELIDKHVTKMKTVKSVKEEEVSEK